MGQLWDARARLAQVQQVLLDASHDVRIDISGEEAQGATVPESAKAMGGLSIPVLGEKFSASAYTGAGATGRCG